MTSEQIMRPGGEIVPVPDQEIISVGPANIDTLERLADEADARVDHMDRIKKALLRFTNDRDWVLFGGKPACTASGAEKLAMGGVSVSEVRKDKLWDDDADGRYYIWHYTGTFSLEGMSRSMEVIGTCSSRDQFFAMVRGELKPLKDIDQTNIMKSGYSNMMVNGVTKLLGLRNLTLRDLEAAGINVDNLDSVEYKTGSQGAASPESKGAQDELWTLCLEMGSGDPKEAANILEDLSAFSFTPRSGDNAGKNVDVAGKRNVKELTEGRVKKTLEGAQKAVATYRAATDDGAEHGEAQDRADIFNEAG